MFLRKIINNTKRSHWSWRDMSSECHLVDLKLGHDGISILTMQRPPVNAINLDLLQDIDQAIIDTENNGSKGLIITSSSPQVFSGGLDFAEIYNPDMKRTEKFWRKLQEVYLRLFTTKIITAAAINGHAPGTGCLLSIATEYRVMVKECKIGLNETSLGTMAPQWYMDAFCHTIPVRQAEYALTTGKLFGCEEALKVGLIDEAAENREDAIEKCKTFIARFDDINTYCRTLTKERIRSAVVKKFQEKRELDVEEYLSFITNPELQKNFKKKLHQIIRQKQV